MIFRVIIEERAALDITAYGEWIAAQGSPRTAAHWIDGIQDAIQSLSAMPHMFALAPEAEGFGREIRQFIFKSHRVLFVIEEDRVHVLHVRHGARLPLSPDTTE